MGNETQKVDVLVGEIQLALQIESNYPASGWAVELRRSLQRKNDELAELIEASHEALAAGLMDINGEPDRLRETLARIGGDK